MTTIVSIHQPNNDLFHMFDNIYVLAKGGVCVYTGEPLNLRQHLIECNINCNENRVPIEVLIKLSFEGIYNQSIKQLSDKTKQLNNSLHLFKTNMKLINNDFNT